MAFLNSTWQVVGGERNELAADLDIVSVTQIYQGKEIWCAVGHTAGTVTQLSRLCCPWCLGSTIGSLRKCFQALTHLRGQSSSGLAAMEVETGYHHIY